jgi:hypothetical protein
MISKLAMIKACHKDKWAPIEPWLTMAHCCPLLILFLFLFSFPFPFPSQ